MTEEAMLRGCIRNVAVAQQELYYTYSPRMLSLCYRYAKSREDAEDMLQEGFIKVFTQIKQFQNRGALEGWIRKIMVNTALNFLKTNQKYRYDLSFDETPLHAVSTENPEVNLHAKELAELIRQLPTGFQTIFNLHAVEGFKHVEIASMLGISEGTSRSQYARARVILIQWIEKNSVKDQKGHYGTK